MPVDYFNPCVVRAREYFAAFDVVLCPENQATTNGHSLHFTDDRRLSCFDNERQGARTAGPSRPQIFQHSSTVINTAQHIYHLRIHNDKNNLKKLVNSGVILLT